ncbi:MAG: efflux RND transporter periplasmic adaptor subunit [Alphaproteobacteria bacterium]|nr:efflux RND transporter periplasmic adaptor subunit [Alphaproteobacteria bacterium]
MPDSEPDHRPAAGRARAAEATAVHPLARSHAMGADRTALRRFALPAVIALAIVGAGLWYFGILGGRSNEASPAATTAAKPAAEADVVTVTEPQLQQIKTGKVEPRDFRSERTAVGQIALNEDLTTPIFAPYAGRVTTLLVRPGDQVKHGDVLFEIDSPDLVQAESTLITAASTLQKTRSQLDLANRSVARQRDLFNVKAVAQKELEQAQADQRGAESDFRGASGALAAARDALRLFGKTDAEIKRIEDERRTDPIMPVRAPIGGTVVTRKAGPGQYVQPSNTDPVVTIADLSRIWMVANVPELDVPFIHLDDEVEVKVAAYPNEVFRARITNIGAVVDPNTRRVTVRSEIEPKGFALKPQMFATFRIVTNTGTPSPAVPSSAVLRDGDKASVWVEIEPRKFTPRKIERGMEQNGMTQVTSGLKPGDVVVTEGAVFLGNALVTGSK